MELKEERDRPGDFDQPNRVFFDFVPIGLIQLDALSRIQNVSCWLEERFSPEIESKEDLIGLTFSDSIVAKTTGLGDAVRDLLRGESFPPVEISTKRKSGQKGWICRVSGMALYGSLGEISGALITIEDVTARRELEERSSLSSTLDIMGDLAGKLALDFNEFIKVILSHASYLKGLMKPDSPYYSDVMAIESASLTAAEIAERLRNCTRRSRNEFISLNLNAVVHELANLMQRSWKSRVTFTFELDAALPPIQGDAVQIQRALLNLFTNACRSMPYGGSVRIRTGSMNRRDAEALGLEDALQGAVWISMQDEGTGLLPEVKDNLFQPFFSDGADGQGQGLGLCSVYSILKRHRGTVKVESQVGRGSTFTLYFPASPGVSEGADLIEGTLSGGGELILLVDGEPAVLSVGRRLLEAGGYRVTIALTGEQALEIYEENDAGIDLVILDQSTPYKRDHEILRDLLTINPQARVLLSSGCTSESSMVVALEAGAVGFIQKPYRMKHLLKKVREALQSRERRPA